MEPKQTDLQALIDDLARYPVAKPVQALLVELVVRVKLLESIAGSHVGAVCRLDHVVFSMGEELTKAQAEREHARCAMRSIAQLIRDGATAGEVLPVLLQLVEGEGCADCPGGCEDCGEAVSLSQALDAADGVGEAPADAGKPGQPGAEG